MAECDCESPMVQSDWFASGTWDGTCRRCGRELPQSWWGIAPDTCEGCGDSTVPLSEKVIDGKTSLLCVSCAE